MRHMRSHSDRRAEDEDPLDRWRRRSTQHDRSPPRHAHALPASEAAPTNAHLKGWAHSTYQQPSERLRLDPATTCGIALLGRRSSGSAKEANDPKLLNQEKARALACLDSLQEQGQIDLEGREAEVVLHQNVIAHFDRACAAQWDLTNFNQVDIFMVNSTGFVYQPTEWLVALSRCKADSMWILYNSANEQVPLTTQHLTLVMERDDPYDVPSTDPLFPWQQGAEYRQAERAAAAAMNREWDGASRTKNKVGPPEVTTKLSQQFVTTYGEDVPAYKSTFTGPNAKTEVDKIYRRYAAEKLRRDKITLPFVIKAAIRKMPKPTDLELTGASAASSPSARPFVFDNKACPMLDCTFQTINPDPVGLASHYLSAHVHGKIRVSRLECPGRIHQNCGHRIDTGNSLVIAINDHCAVQANKISARDLALLTASPAAKRLHFAEVAKAQPEKIQALRQQWNEQRQPTGNRGQKQKRLQSDQENDISIAGPSFKKKR